MTCVTFLVAARDLAGNQRAGAPIPALASTPCLRVNTSPASRYAYCPQGHLRQHAGDRCDAKMCHWLVPIIADSKLSICAKIVSRPLRSPPISEKSTINQCVALHPRALPGGPGPASHEPSPPRLRCGG